MKYCLVYLTKIRNEVFPKINKSSIKPLLIKVEKLNKTRNKRQILRDIYYTDNKLCYEIDERGICQIDGSELNHRILFF